LLVYARQAQRQLEKLNPQTALRIVEGRERLKRKVELYRLRVGDFRVVFQRSGSRIDVIDVLSKPDFQKVY
jgi:mRNA-degrading endonuclease RelE of RelBE toxin-antitoxin system